MNKLSFENTLNNPAANNPHDFALQINSKVFEISGFSLKSEKEIQKFDTFLKSDPKSYQSVIYGAGVIGSTDVNFFKRYLSENTSYYTIEINYVSGEKQEYEFTAEAFKTFFTKLVPN